MKSKQMLAWITLLGLLIPASAQADAPASSAAVHLNGKNLKLQHAPIEEKAGFLIPLREVLEASGWKITWYDEDQTITAEKQTGNQNHSLKVSIGYSRGAFNGNMLDLPVPPRLVDGTAYLPATALQHLDMKLDWDEAKRVLIIEEAPEARTFVYLNGSRYEGELFGGVPNGRGKLYSAEGRLIYEGEMANGLAHGSGKLYNKDGTLQYSGSFKHDQFHGWGKAYRADGTLEYAGMFSYGERTPGGFSYLSNGIKWVPDREAPALSQRKTVIYPNGVMFTGTFSGGRAEGEGKLASLFGEVIAEGIWKEGRLETESGSSTRLASVSDSVYYSLTTHSTKLRRYVSEAHGFDVQLPDVWLGKPLEIKEGPDEVSFFYISPSQPDRKALLFTIKQYTEKEWPGTGTVVRLREHNGWVYGYAIESGGADLPAEEAADAAAMRESSGQLLEGFRLIRPDVSVSAEDLKRPDKELWEKFAHIEKWTLQTAGIYPEGVWLNECDKQLVTSRLQEVYDPAMAERMFANQNRPVDGGYEPIPIGYVSIAMIEDDLRVKREQDSAENRLRMTIAGDDVEVMYTLDSATRKIVDYQVIRSNY
ncbi:MULTISPECIES: stalk domain-containing protein [unclassified Paenibacillus]|uniref:stalk domain-containing protein n=1 Tax=unclassified Paenibacillus TaxID=185978 RepID=UPI0021183ADB|nr:MULTISPECIES: stalk domain-containing protein [unclassified Paenibacillus]